MLISFLRTVVLYLLLIVTVRLMGKRQIGEMEPAEFVVTMLLANLAAIPMQDSAIPLLSGLVPILVILGLELILAAVSLQSIRMRRLLCGKPVILMQNGKILERNLQRTRVNLDELTMHLREKGIFDLSTVKFAILETNGQLSTLLYAKEQPASARDAGIRAESDYRSEKLGYKIREAQMQKIPYMLVVGDRDMENQTVSVRTRAGVDLGAMSVDDFRTKCRAEIDTKVRD